MTLTAHLPGSVEEVGVLGLVADGVLHLEMGLNHRVDEGYDTLPSRMSSGLDIRLGFAVEAVEWGSAGVTLRSPAGEELRARAAVCTLPVGVLKSGSVRFLPELPESKRTALEGIEMGPVLKLLLHFRERFWPEWAASRSAHSPVCRKSGTVVFAFVANTMRSSGMPSALAQTQANPFPRFPVGTIKLLFSAVWR